MPSGGSGLAPAEGRLLVASPVIGDANFFRTVVGLLEHDDRAGTLGVVLNRPTDLTVLDTVPGWEATVSPPGVLFTGGPVSGGSALGIGLVGDAAAGEATAGTAGALSALFDHLAVVDLDADPALVLPSLRDLRIYRGYAGWGPRQLAGELRTGAWWVFESAPTDWFSTAPQDLWSAVLARQGGAWRMWAHAPEDPEVN